MNAASIQASIGADVEPFRAAGEQAVTTAESIAGKIEHHFSGRGIGMALSTALGLNIEAISEKVARLFSDLTKEEEELMKSSEEIGRRTTGIYKEIWAARNTQAQNVKTKEEENISLEKQAAEIVSAVAARQAKYDADRGAALERLADLGVRGAAANLKIIDDTKQTVAEKNQLDEIGLAIAENQKEIEAGTRTIKKEAAAEEVASDRLHDENIVAGEKLDADRVAKEMLYNRELYDDVAAAAAMKNNEDEKNAKTNEEIARLELKGVENLTDAERVQLDILTKKLTTRQRDAEIALLLDKGVANLTDDEKKRLAVLVGSTIEVVKQSAVVKSMIDAWTGFAVKFSTTGADNSQLSDRELANKVEKLRKDIAARNADNMGRTKYVGSDPAGFYDPFLDIQTQNLQGTLSEIATRQNVVSNVKAFGQDAAFAQSSLTESRFAEILRTATDSGKIIDQLQQLNASLKNGTAQVRNVPLYAAPGASV